MVVGYHRSTALQGFSSSLQGVSHHTHSDPHTYTMPSPHSIQGQGLQQAPRPTGEDGKQGKGMAAVNFAAKNEAELWRWVEANPEHVNDKDVHSETPLFVAVCNLDNVPLTAWLLDKKGADLDMRCRIGLSLLHVAKSLNPSTWSML